MLDASGYGCLAAHRKGERRSASSYKFVNVYFPACYILLYLVSGDRGGSASTVMIVCVCVCHLLNSGLIVTNKAFTVCCVMNHLIRQAVKWVIMSEIR